MRSNRIRTTALAATALLAALSLTACGGNDNGNDDKAGAVAPAASTTPTTPDTGKDTQETDSGTADAPAKNASDASKGSTGATGSTGGQKSNAGATGGQKSNAGTTGSGSKSAVTCTGANTKVTVSKVSRPINHLLLTATNTGSGPCYAYHAPKLQFDDAQAVFPILRDSIPQAVVTLAPGQSAYASIGLSGEPDGQELYKGTHLAVYFAGKSDQGSTGAPAELTLPAGTSWGNNGFVTYWQSEMADALTY
ncbi:MULTISPECIES: DUF4232 domain-containing protein [unclassified Streptomyces]|uniref:DUF4232 domain-containing protein n=1 Tax=unclassified Streptomyces TaxID=2593676 RepID=UPI002257F627|nr:MULTISPECIES: DUF4232 domain-containing protein [unclassified Streptomyces]WSP55774.1 DUF4232 domain-containing protein [Streptomyces sp. NBC_01241]WSU23489.1 DUF4232 domain-containing protein [Streptomyces sp. NBC_01108]MCX4787483.1 DUF4232 domain-containing protein [Streptomyces sp. NBC_01221]MCX4796732.1 DUF4232 domain-containing protein [Streptomyces sp. NBC_01242]WSJ37959.1 DUF4232 domain-containing protein [Streptomyces sp. NBC_01321]